MPLQAQRAGADARELHAFEVRDRAARLELETPAVAQEANDDERLYPNHIGSYSKGLPHDDFGTVNDAAFRSLLDGLRVAKSPALERVPLGGNEKLVNPLAGIAFDLEGRDIQKLAAPPAPGLASFQRAEEAIELYWMALARDVAFSDFGLEPITTSAARELRISPAELFRGFTPGDWTGPYVSQLFLTPFNYGAYPLDGRIMTFASGSDFLSDSAPWLACQNGLGPFGPPRFDPQPRYFRNGRDLAAYVHSDQACEAFYNAGLRLYALGAPANPGNPYLLTSKQAPFATFGEPAFLTLQSEAALRAVKAVFFQKWFVHRTLRPEEFGGLVQATLSGRAAYPIHPALLHSEALARCLNRFGTGLLPQAFPEGCPQHPSYVQAHGGVAGACGTVLKCAFDGSTPWLTLAPGLKQASDDGLQLVNYEGLDAAAITIDGEINKLCSNIALARNFAGVHWRADYEAGLRLGEEMALTVLADQRHLYPEDFRGFRITKFDGTTITA